MLYTIGYARLTPQSLAALAAKLHAISRIVVPSQCRGGTLDSRYLRHKCLAD